MLGIFPKAGRISNVASNNSPNPYTISFQVILYRLKLHGKSIKLSFLKEVTLCFQDKNK